MTIEERKELRLELLKELYGLYFEHNEADVNIKLTEQDEADVNINLTEQNEFECLLTNLSDMLKDERIPLEVRKEYEGKTFKLFNGVMR